MQTLILTSCRSFHPEENPRVLGECKLWEAMGIESLWSAVPLPAQTGQSISVSKGIYSQTVDRIMLLVQTLLMLSLLPRREMHASSLILYGLSLSMNHIYPNRNWDQNPNKVTRRFACIEAAKSAPKSLMSPVRKKQRKKGKKKKRKSQELFSTKHVKAFPMFYQALCWLHCSEVYKLEQRLSKSLSWLTMRACIFRKLRILDWDFCVTTYTKTVGTTDGQHRNHEALPSTSTYTASD